MKHENEKGMALLATAILLPVIIGIVGLGIDLGVAYAVRTSAQAAADAGALAGATSYMLDPTPNPVNDAVLVTNAHTILGQAINIGSGNVSVATCSTPQGAANCVTVTVPTSAPTFFAKIFGFAGVPITVKATALAGGPGSGTGAFCMKPIFAPQSLISGYSSGQDIPDIRPSNPNNALVPSDYYSLNFGGGCTGVPNPCPLPPVSQSVPWTDGTSSTSAGNPTYMAGWTNCLAIPIKCGDNIPVATGSTPNSTGKAAYQAGYTDTWNSLGNYGSNNSDTSNSLVVAALWQNGFMPSGGNNATAYVTVSGFVELFIDPYTDSSGQTAVSAHLIKQFTCSAGAGGGGGAGSGTGPLGAPLKLVQP